MSQRTITSVSSWLVVVFGAVCGAYWTEWFRNRRIPLPAEPRHLRNSHVRVIPPQPVVSGSWVDWEWLESA